MSARYHILNLSIPSDPDGVVLDGLLKANGYPELRFCQAHSQGCTWFAFTGNKEDILEEDFNPWLIANLPALFNGKSINMSLAELLLITDSFHEGDEALGWQDPRIGAIYV